MSTEAKLQKDIKSMQTIVSKLAKEQKDREVVARRRYKLCLAVIAGLTTVLCTMLICFTVYGVTVFREQQQESSAQLHGLLELLSGAESTEVHTGDNGVIITGDQNKTEVQH